MRKAFGLTREKENKILFLFSVELGKTLWLPDKNFVLKIIFIYLRSPRLFQQQQQKKIQIFHPEKDNKE